MAILIKNDGSIFSIIASDLTLMWSLRSPGCPKVTGIFNPNHNEEFKMYLFEHVDNVSFIIMFWSVSKYAFYAINPSGNPCGIVCAIEDSYTDFNELMATRVDLSSMRPYKCALPPWPDAVYYVPNELYESVDYYISTLRFNSYIEHSHNVMMYDGSRVIIINEINNMTLRLEKSNGEVHTYVSEVDDSTDFPYVTERDFILVKTDQEANTWFGYCYDLETLAKAIETPGIIKEWIPCKLAPPFHNGCPIRCIEPEYSSGFVQPQGQQTNIETALECGLPAEDLLFNSVKKLPRLPAIFNHNVTRINGVYVCLSSGAIFMHHHTILLDVKVTKYSNNFVVIGGVNIPIDNRALINAIHGYAYSEPNADLVPCPPVELVNPRMVFITAGVLEVLTVYSDEGVVTLVTQVTDLGNESQFTHEFPDLTVENDPKKRAFYMYGVKTMFYYGNTLAVIYTDRIELYTNLVSVIGVLEQIVLPSFTLPNYYVEFAGMYLAMRPRCNSKPSMYVYGTGEVVYSMIHLDIVINDVIIEHGPARVAILTLHQVRKIEWLSERSEGHTSVLIPDTTIYRNSIVF